MNTDLILRTGAALLTLAAAATAGAGDLYDRAAQNRANTVVTPADTGVAPGGVARHLIYLGVDAGQAMERAREVGERPLAQQPMAPQPRSGGYDLYDRVAATNAAAMAAANGVVMTSSRMKTVR